MSKGSGNSRGNDKTHNIVSKQKAIDFLLKYAASPNSGFEGVKRITFYKDTTDDIAAHYLNEIGINESYDKLYLDGKRLRMGDDLRRAIYNIQNGKDMSYRQEFALAAVWHEALHSQSPWTRGKGATPKQLEVMESINEFCATMTFGNFVTRLGGNSKYSDRILKESPMYSSRGLVKELRDSRIPLNVAYNELHKIHTTTKNARTYKSAVYSKLKELGVKDPDKIFV